MTYHRFSIIQGRAVIDRRVTNAQLRTLTALGMYADPDGWCFPSQSTIGDDLGKSRQTVNEDIAKLVEYGYVEKDSVTLQNNQIRMRYRLLHDTKPTGGVSESRQGVSEYPDSNDPSNDPINTGDGLSSLPVEWQVAAGVKNITVHDEKEAQMKDSANLIAQGTGALHNAVFLLAYTFMTTRGIIIPLQDAKGNRKAAKAMVSQGVLPHHVESAVKYMIQKNLTCVDMFSVQKIATNEANPAPESYDGAIEGV